MFSLLRRTGRMSSVVCTQVMTVLGRQLLKMHIAEVRLPGTLLCDYFFLLFFSLHMTMPGQQEPSQHCFVVSFRHNIAGNPKKHCGLKLIPHTIVQE